MLQQFFVVLLCVFVAGFSCSVFVDVLACVFCNWFVVVGVMFLVVDSRRYVCCC